MLFVASLLDMVYVRPGAGIGCMASVRPRTLPLTRGADADMFRESTYFVTWDYEPCTPQRSHHHHD